MRCISIAEYGCIHNTTVVGKVPCDENLGKAEIIKNNENAKVRSARSIN